MPNSMLHYTDKAGFDGIRSAPEWKFRAETPPRDSGHERGAYFTNLPRDAPQLAKKLRIPRAKTEYFFEFKDAGDLSPLNGGRGDFIFFSSSDYLVEKARQLASGANP